MQQSQKHPIKADVLKSSGTPYDIDLVSLPVYHVPTLMVKTEESGEIMVQRSKSTQVHYITGEVVLPENFKYARAL